jgi:lipopolysaccharide export system protein LptA
VSRTGSRRSVALALLLVAVAGGGTATAQIDTKPRNIVPLVQPDAKAKTPETTRTRVRRPRSARNRNDPIKIDANTLEVRDKEKVAVFKGNVVVVQGDTTLRCRELTVHYEASALTGVAPAPAAPKAKAAAPAPLQAPTAAQPAATQRIRRLVAVGGVIVTSKDQRATGNHGVYDTQANTVTLTGDVVVTQGPNVMRGDLLIVDLTTGLSNLYAGNKTTPGRVHGLFIPGTIREKDKKETPVPAGSPPKPVPLPQRQ